MTYRKNVDVVNNLDKVYIIGDESTDGSIRITFTDGDSVARIVSRANGVWNKTGFQISAGTLFVGDDFTIGAAGSFIETFNSAIADAHQNALIPHVPFDDSGTGLIHTPILDVLETSIIFGTAITEISSTTISISFTTTNSRFIKSISHEVGTTGASSEIRYKIFKGTDNTGIEITDQNKAASDFSAETTATITFTGNLGLNSNSDYFIELASDNTFSLKVDASGNPLTTFLDRETTILGIVTENLMIDENLNFMFDTSLNPMYAIQFP